MTGELMKNTKSLMRKLCLLAALIVLIPWGEAYAESVYDRVIKTQELRCGYGIFPPMVLKDPNTGEISGIFVDLMKEIGYTSGLKVEFTEEIDWGQIAEALKSQRIDAFCSGMWGTAKRGKDIAFSSPLFYSVTKAYGRINDTRFDHNPAAMNDPAVRLSVNEGDVSEDIARRFFPNAEKVYKTPMTGEEFTFMNVTSHKADIAFTAPSTAKSFIRNNPGSLREIPLKKPLSVNQNVIGVDIHERELQNLLNAAVTDIKNNGVIKEVFERYGPDVTEDFMLNLDWVR